MGIFDDIKGQASAHPDEVAKGIDKVGDLIDEKTGGKFADKVDQAQAAAKKELGAEEAAPADQAAEQAPSISEAAEQTDTIAEPVAEDEQPELVNPPADEEPAAPAE